MPPSRFVETGERDPDPTRDLRELWLEYSATPRATLTRDAFVAWLRSRLVVDPLATPEMRAQITRLVSQTVELTL